MVVTAAFLQQVQYHTELPGSRLKSLLYRTASQPLSDLLAAVLGELSSAAGAMFLVAIHACT